MEVLIVNKLVLINRKVFKIIPVVMLIMRVIMIGEREDRVMIPAW